MSLTIFSTLWIVVICFYIYTFSILLLRAFSTFFKIHNC